MAQFRLYGKWEEPEAPEDAFQKVKSGEWSMGRFIDWADHVRFVTVRDAAADESY